jgi:hypothetical protein
LQHESCSFFVQPKQPKNSHSFQLIKIRYLKSTYFCRLKLAIPKEEDHQSYSKCSMYAVNFTEILLRGGANESEKAKWPIKSCSSGWEYNFTEIPYSTIATEVSFYLFFAAFILINLFCLSQLDWVCENSYLPTLSQSIFFVGAIVGGLLFG